jgi:hypothetical protein
MQKAEHEGHEDKLKKKKQEAAVAAAVSPSSRGPRCNSSRSPARARAHSAVNENCWARCAAFTALVWAAGVWESVPQQLLQLAQGLQPDFRAETEPSGASLASVEVEATAVHYQEEPAREPDETEQERMNRWYGDLPGGDHCCPLGHGCLGDDEVPSGAYMVRRLHCLPTEEFLLGRGLWF